ncbi:hypothetical protein ACJX0J_026099 [Zea mays]
MANQMKNLQFAGSQDQIWSKTAKHVRGIPKYEQGKLPMEQERIADDIHNQYEQKGQEIAARILAIKFFFFLNRHFFCHRNPKINGQWGLLIFFALVHMEAGAIHQQA